MILFYFFADSRVLAFDPERLQFVADIQTPVQDPSSLYILSSRFHRFFLKNLDTRDINTRILRISGATLPSQLQHTAIPSSVSGFSTSPYTFGNTLNFPTSSPILYKTEIPLAGTRPIINDIKSSFVDNYFNSIRQPYQYEPVGIINKANKNPFTALNTGERPEVFIKSRPQYNTYQQQQPHPQPHQTYLPHSAHQSILGSDNYGILQNPSYFSKLNSNFNDFNSVRRAKSVTFNSTVFH